MGEYICTTEIVARSVREYGGVKRKAEIGAMVRELRIDSPKVIASFGEDAAVIENKQDALLLAADGIWSVLMDADPYWSGYCAVLVNIHDIAAMGGKPIAMVDILSVANDDIRDRVIAGMRDASAQFGVPIVGGHLHPDTPYNAIDVAILGIVDKNSIIYSNTARTGDVVLVAIDLFGRVHPSCFLNWDSVTKRTADEVRAQIQVMAGLGTDKLVTAGKDISNPGIIGTLGMLLEVSGKGARIDLEKIPMPDICPEQVPFERWVRMYPGMGFVLTLCKEHEQEVIDRFCAVGMSAAVIGEVTDSHQLLISYKGDDAIVFDFIDDGIMHLS